MRPKDARRNINRTHIQSAAECASSASRIGVLTRGAERQPDRVLIPGMHYDIKSKRRETQ